MLCKTNINGTNEVNMKMSVVCVKDEYVGLGVKCVCGGNAWK